MTFSSWSGRVSGARLLAGGVIACGLALLGDVGQTAILDVGLVFGAIIAFAAAGTWSPRSIVTRLALAAIVAGSLMGLSAQAAFG